MVLRAGSNDAVPDVKEWITFVRQKATQADKSQKAATIEVTPHYKRTQDSRRDQPKGSRQKSHQKQEGKVYLATPQTTEGESPHRTTKPTTTCKVSCGLCGQLHYLFACKQFLGMAVSKRKAHVQSASICSNCLRPGHETNACSSTYRCKLCKGEHNTLLHVDVVSAPVHSVCAVKSTLSQQREGLLMTSKVKLTGPSGQTTVVTALLDSGAGISIVSKRVMKTLQLLPSNEWVTLAGIEGPDLSIPRPTAWLTVSSLTSENWDRPSKWLCCPG